MISSRVLINSMMFSVSEVERFAMYQQVLM